MCIRDRVIKTKGNIIASFLKLLQQKDIQKISVKEICDLAQCGRNTFYNYYPDKEKLYEEIIRDLVTNVTRGFVEPENYISGTYDERSEVFIRNVLNAFSTVKNIFSIMPLESERFASFIRDLENEIAGYSYSRAMACYDLQSKQKQELQLICSKIMAAAVVSFGVYWLTETQYTLDEAIDIFRPTFADLMLSTEKQILG